jgi:16S rRNA processing protein RimM
VPRSGWFVIGVVTGPFGLRGEVKVHPLTDLPERYREGLCCSVGRDPVTASDMRVTAVRWHKGRAVVRFAGVDDREAAEALRGCELFLPDSERANLPADTYYDDDLVGLEVYTEDGRFLGTLDRVLHYAANDVYEAGGILIPAVKHVVTRVDLPAGRITIRPIPGLLEGE